VAPSCTRRASRSSRRTTRAPSHPGAEYPLTTAPTGAASLAKTVKWGQDTKVTDEAIARQKMQPVNKAMIKLVNQNVKYVDSAWLSAIASAVTASRPRRRPGRRRRQRRSSPTSRWRRRTSSR
jgi:hypothetical protein